MHPLPVSEHYISHRMLNILVFLMILCALSKTLCIFVYKRYCVVKKLLRYAESEMHYMCRKVAHEQCLQKAFIFLQ